MNLVVHTLHFNIYCFFIISINRFVNVLYAKCSKEARLLNNIKHVELNIRSICKRITLNTFENVPLISWHFCYFICLGFVKCVVSNAVIRTDSNVIVKVRVINANCFCLPRIRMLTSKSSAESSKSTLCT